MCGYRGFYIVCVCCFTEKKEENKKNIKFTTKKKSKDIQIKNYLKQNKNLTKKNLFS